MRRCFGFVSRSAMVFVSLLAMIVISSSATGPIAAVAQPSVSTVSTPRSDSVSVETGERPSDYLQAARGALVLGRIMQAREALEMAQTRLLDRSVPMGQTNNPSGDPLSEQIFQARQALAAGDRATCVALIEAAINSAAAQGL